MFDQYLNEFVPSMEIREYLKNSNIGIDEMSDVIYHAPVSLEKKYIALERLLKEESCNKDSHCSVYLDSIKRALEIIEKEGVFSLEVGEGNQEGQYQVPVFEGVFSCFTDAMEYVEKYYKNYNEDYTWYEISKWVCGIDGKLFNACTYYVFKKEIYFINLDHSILNEYFLGISSNANLSIPVPFHAGDIVETNLAPFAGKKKMIILETGDNVDCCCLQALYQNEDGLWDIGAVKHGQVGVDVVPKISPLYYMEKYTGILDNEESILQDISKYIDGDENKGSVLWNKIYRLNRAVSIEELASFLGSDFL